MRKLELFRMVAVLVLVGIVCALAATAASAAPPEFGKCEPVKAEKEGKKTVYHGGFTDSKCTKVSASKEGKYEWYPLTGSIAFTAVGTPMRAEGGKKKGSKPNELVCVTTEDHGSLSTFRVRIVVIFKGCQSGTMKYESEKQEEGTVVTSELEGTLGIEKAGGTAKQDKVGIAFKPVTEEIPWWEIFCVIGPKPIIVGGTAIARISPNHQSTGQTLTFSGSNGKQKPEQFEGGVKEVLSGKFEGAATEQVQITTTLSLTLPEAVELNTVV